MSENSYELEILRLLYLFAPMNPDVKDMITDTITRLKTTCFAYRDCHLGECFHSALIALRFLSTVSDDKEWLNMLVDYFHKYNGETYRHSNTVWYFWLCLSELPYEIAEPEIIKYRDEFYSRLNKSYVMNSENDKIHHPVLCCVLRNCLSRLPEYTYIKDRNPYVSEKDKRLHFDMERSAL